ncbi:helix-turn-helix domain-containing protein [Algoriphagus halophytocola]|uniref:Helix-turn-helix domain-containing protein n=1 Tax=Algoriphagus halophytocola TaxID=2991499 RepID=A0ABY6MF52_9BACT|nr:helix-turn-helix transcriptional regulator [Algoriphagus sp. TR-M5]UZD21808.1 helix-turn-helix domain-containing protein [Algoriphagus sp. TR-M5]
MELEEKEKLIKQLAEKLKELKVKSKLSYRILAQRCNLDHADIKKYENGGVDIRFTTIIELAKAYGVHPTEILNLDYKIDFNKTN